MSRSVSVAVLPCDAEGGVGGCGVVATEGVSTAPAREVGVTTLVALTGLLVDNGGVAGSGGVSGSGE